MTRLAALLVALVALLAPAAVASAAPPATLTPGQLTVGLNLPSEGFQIGVADGSRVIYARGLEIDLAAELAKRLELPATTFIQSPFSSVIGPGAKPWDLALAEVTVTARRGQDVDFSAPYMRADQGVLLSQYLARKPRTLTAMRGLRLCAESGTTGSAAIRNRIHATRPAQLFPDVPTLMLNLQLGQCDAAVADLPMLATMKANAPRRYGALAGRMATGERYAAVLPKGSTLTARVDAAITAMLGEGTIAGLQRRWLDVSLAKVKILPR